jgi:hypothetical protein
VLNVPPISLSKNWLSPKFVLLMIHHHHHHPTRLGLDRPVSVSSNNLFKVLPRSSQTVFFYLVYNSALYLASCCFSFLLHVVPNFICIFLVSCQLVLLWTIPELFPSMFGQKGCSRLFFWKKFNLRLMSIFFSGSKFHYRMKVVTASTLHTFILEISGRNLV